MAFSGCSGLTEIYVKAVTPPSIGSSGAFHNVSTTIPVYVLCGSKTAYEDATHWNNFTNIIEEGLFDINVQSNDDAMGTATVTQANTCADNTAIIEATPKADYRFVQWNDGNTENPRTITVLSDTTFKAIFEMATGIEKIEASTISVYPNPARDNLHITLPTNVHQAVLTVYDMQGKVLIRKEINSQDAVSVNNLVAGIYIYNVMTEKQNHTGKIIVSD
jgi:hypothetical protein